jgi:hypothetical protein
MLAERVFTELSFGGWVFMLVSTISVTWLTYWCFKRVLKGGEEPPTPPGLGP